MKTYKIAVGTNSESKIGYLQDVLKEIGVRAEVFPTEVESGVSEQPLTQEETQEGSRNRAERALKKNPDVDFGLGIEVGYHKNEKGILEMFCCTTVLDRNNFVGSCFSSRFPLPKYHQGIIEEGKYLGSHVRAYMKDINEPVTNYVRELVRGRKPLITEAIRNTLLRYFKREEY